MIKPKTQQALRQMKWVKEEKRISYADHNMEEVQHCQKVQLQRLTWLLASVMGGGGSL